jgi:NAD-dependent deacetylase
MLRPHVVWFGENLDRMLLDQAMTASSKSDIFFIIGTSGVVQPAASFAALARAAGAYVVEINLESTSLSQTADESILGRAGEILPELIRRLKTN